MESCLILLESNISSMKILYRSEFSLQTHIKGERQKKLEGGRCIDRKLQIFMQTVNACNLVMVTIISCSV